MNPEDKAKCLQLFSATHDMRNLKLAYKLKQTLGGLSDEEMLRAWAKNSKEDWFGEHWHFTAHPKGTDLYSSLTIRTYRTDEDDIYNAGVVYSAMIIRGNSTIEEPQNKDGTHEWLCWPEKEEAEYNFYCEMLQACSYIIIDKAVAPQANDLMNFYQERVYAYVEAQRERSLKHWMPKILEWVQEQINRTY